MSQTQTQPEAGYLLPKDGGMIDVWWPYQPQVGRYTIKIGGEQGTGACSSSSAGTGAVARRPRTSTMARTRPST
jgi:hypothetical protein